MVYRGPAVAFPPRGDAPLKVELHSFRHALCSEVGPKKHHTRRASRCRVGGACGVTCRTRTRTGRQSCYEGPPDATTSTGIVFRGKDIGRQKKHLKPERNLRLNPVYYKYKYLDILFLTISEKQNKIPTSWTTYISKHDTSFVRAGRIFHMRAAHKAPGVPIIRTPEGLSSPGVRILRESMGFHSLGLEISREVCLTLLSAYIPPMRTRRTGGPVMSTLFTPSNQDCFSQPGTVDEEKNKLRDRRDSLK